MRIATYNYLKIHNLLTIKAYDIYISDDQVNWRLIMKTQSTEPNKPNFENNITKLIEEWYQSKPTNLGDTVASTASTAATSIIRTKEEIVKATVAEIQKAFGFDDAFMGSKISDLNGRRGEAGVKKNFDSFKNFLVKKPGFFAKLISKDAEETKYLKKLRNPDKINSNSETTVAQCLEREITRKLKKSHKEGVKEFSFHWCRNIAAVVLGTVVIALAVAVFPVTAYVALTLMDGLPSPSPSSRSKAGETASEPKNKEKENIEKYAKSSFVGKIMQKKTRAEQQAGRGR